MRNISPFDVCRFLQVAFICGCMLIFTLLLQVVHGDQSTDSDNQQPKVAKTDAESKPRDIPDYTKLTGCLEAADLPILQPEVLWKMVSEFSNPNGEGKPIGISNLAIADGILYFGDDRGNLVALSTEMQSELWSHPHGVRIATTPTVDQQHVYFGSTKGVTALRRSDGNVAWSFQFAHGAGEATPLPVGDFVYFSGYDGNSYCLKRTNGVLVWQHDFGADAPKDPDGFVGAKARFQNIVARPNGAACDGELFVQSVFDQSRVIAIDCKTGQRRWTFQAAGWISPAPTIADGRVYVASQDKHLYCLDLTSGKLLWKFNATTWLASQVAVSDGRVYLSCHKSRLVQLSADTGELIRTMEPPEPEDRQGAVYSFPIIANQTVYFATGKGLLLAFNLESGALRWKLRPSEGSELFTNPVTDGRQIYVTTRPSLEKTGESAVVAVGINR